MGIFAVDLAPRPSALTSDGEKFDYVYNPWGQLVRIVGLGGDAVTKAVAVYTYSAMGHRISEQLDTNDGGNSGMPDTVVDSNDPVFYIATDPSGRRLATYRDLDSDPKESFIHHDARIRGPVHQGGPILRDRNANLATAPEEWASVGAEAERYERHYYLLDYRGYVSAIVTGDGTLVEQVRYSATGVPFNIPLGDVNADGKVESGGGGDPDFDNISSMVGLPAKYHVRGDLDLDGDVDAADLGIAQARDGTVTGRGSLTMIGLGHRILMSGAEYDTNLEILMMNRYAINIPISIKINGQQVPGPYIPTLPARSKPINPEPSPAPAPSSGCPDGMGIDLFTGECVPIDFYPPTIDPKPINLGPCNACSPEIKLGLVNAISELTSKGCIIPRIIVVPPNEIEVPAAYDCRAGAILLSCGWYYDHNADGLQPNTLHNCRLCQSILHELTHAVDHCTGLLSCSTNPNMPGFVSDCRDLACSELRAYSTARQCCESWAHPEMYKECLIRSATGSISGCTDGAGHACDQTDVEAVYDRCATGCK